MLENIEVFCHNSIKFDKQKVIYVDPFQIKKEFHDADIILCTHLHSDHFSDEDINKVKKDDTIIVITEDAITKAYKLGFNKDNILIVYPNEKYKVEGIEITTIPAYNQEKKFHPKENNWVGFIIKLEGVNYYITGDTDITKEALEVKCDVMFVAIGGTYTMNYRDAAILVNKVKPKIAVPVHYGSIVGKKEDAIEFAKLVNPSDTICEILIK